MCTACTPDRLPGRQDVVLVSMPSWTGDAVQEISDSDDELTFSPPAAERAANRSEPALPL